jgi:hypothetical protein
VGSKVTMDLCSLKPFLEEISVDSAIAEFGLSSIDFLLYIMLVFLPLLVLSGLPTPAD